ncbi:MAG: NTP transferase domain-containing protein [Gammaproteobacteria bacterium]
MSDAGRLVGVLLAGGAARRFGGGKLRAPLANAEPLGLVSARRVAGAVERLVVVTRAEDVMTTAMFRDAGFDVIASPDAARGMAHSLAAGVAASPDAAAWMIALADMPRVATATLAGLAARWRATDAIVVPACDGRRGHPVIFPARFGAELRTLEGDQGARPLLLAHATEVVPWECGDAGVLTDVDTPDDLRALESREPQASPSTSTIGRGSPTA